MGEFRGMFKGVFSKATRSHPEDPRAAAESAARREATRGPEGKLHGQAPGAKNLSVSASRMLQRVKDSPSKTIEVDVGMIRRRGGSKWSPLGRADAKAVSDLSERGLVEVESEHFRESDAYGIRHRVRLSAKRDL